VSLCSGHFLAERVASTTKKGAHLWRAHHKWTYAQEIIIESKCAIARFGGQVGVCCLR
jgi:hypothetical protein